MHEEFIPRFSVTVPHPSCPLYISNGNPALDRNDSANGQLFSNSVLFDIDRLITRGATTSEAHVTDFGRRWVLGRLEQFDPVRLAPKLRRAEP